MQFKATIDNIALFALVFAVVAIAAVSTIALVSAERLITINAQTLYSQRITSSLENIRFQAQALDIGEQSFIITGSDRDLGPYRTGTVEIEAELQYLAGKRADSAELTADFTELETVARRLIGDVRAVVETRRTQGFAAAQALVRKQVDAEPQRKLMNLTQRLLIKSRQQQNNFELEQSQYGDKVRRLILALITSSAFILIFLYGSMRRLNREQRRAQARIAHQATHDSLTGLFNRPAVMEHIAGRLRDAETEAALGGFALLLLDLDGFKAVNDTHGHDIGDLLLKEVAKRAARVLRESDYISRLGGDEFLIVIPQVSDRETAARVAQKLIDAAQDAYVFAAPCPPITTVTASIGISVFPRDGRSHETLMKCADLALYEAKRSGRNRLRFYQEGLQTE